LELQDFDQFVSGQTLSADILRSQTFSATRGWRTE
jgi:hypothetical protein